MGWYRQNLSLSLYSLFVGYPEVVQPATQLVINLANALIDGALVITRRLIVIEFDLEQCLATV